MKRSGTPLRVLVGGLDQIKPAKKTRVVRAAALAIEPPISLVLQMATARWVESSLAGGSIRDMREAARHLGVSVARVSQLLDLLLLSPEIQQAVCDGEAVPAHFGAHQVRRTMNNAEWAAQKSVWNARTRRSIR